MRGLWKNIMVEVPSLRPLLDAGILIPGDYTSPARINFVRKSSLILTESVDAEHAYYLANEIIKNGYIKAILVDTDYAVLDGHHRVAALTLLGSKIIPVRWVHS